MTTTSGFVEPSHRPAVAAPMVQAPEPIMESIGVDDPGMAHGGRSRRVPGPPIPGALVARVRMAGPLPTRVRRIGMNAGGRIKTADLTATPAAPTPDVAAEMEP